MVLGRRHHVTHGRELVQGARRPLRPTVPFVEGRQRRRRVVSERLLEVLQLAVVGLDHDKEVEV